MHNVTIPKREVSKKMRAFKSVNRSINETNTKN